MNQFQSGVYLYIDHMSRVAKNLSLGFPAMSNTNQPVQLQKMARGLKFGILEVEGFYYICSVNKGADQLRSYSTADLCLCIPICKRQVFS